MAGRSQKKRNIYADRAIQLWENLDPRVRIGVLAFAVFLLLCVVIRSFGRNQGETIYQYLDSKTGVAGIDTHLFDFNGKTKELEKPVAAGKYSAKKDLLVYFADGDLYYVKHSLNPVLIEEDVSGPFYISADSSMVIYQTGKELCMYQIKGGKKKRVADQVADSDWCISPDGKSVLYQKEDAGTTVMCLAGWKDEEKELETDAVPVAIPDGGKYWFYYQIQSGKIILYVGTGKMSQEIDTIGRKKVFVNENGTEIIYVNNEDYTCIYRIKDEESKKVAGKYVSAFVTGNRQIELGKRQTAVLYDSFKGQVFVAEDALYWIDKKDRGVKITSSFQQYKISEDGKSMIYLAGNGRLMKVSKYGSKMESTELYDKDEVLKFYANDDLSRIYLVTDQNELLYYVSAKKQNVIAQEYNKLGAVSMSHADDRLYYIQDGRLYSADKKTVKEEAESAGTLFGQDYLGLIYTSKDEKILYYRESGKWKVILEAE